MSTVIFYRFTFISASLLISARARFSEKSHKISSISKASPLRKYLFCSCTHEKIVFISLTVLLSCGRDLKRFSGCDFEIYILFVYFFLCCTFELFWNVHDQLSICSLQLEQFSMQFSSCFKFHWSRFHCSSYLFFCVSNFNNHNFYGHKRMHFVLANLLLLSYGTER